MTNARKVAEKAGGALRREGLIFQTSHQESDEVEEILEPIIESAIEVALDEQGTIYAENHQKHVENLECSLFEANKRIAELEKDQDDWNKGVELIAGSLGEDHKCCVSLSHKALEIRAENEIKDQRIAELEEQIRDSAESFKAVMEEKCPTDEIHCTCVPFLRERITELEKAFGEETP